MLFVQLTEAPPAVHPPVAAQVVLETGVTVLVGAVLPAVETTVTVEPPGAKPPRAGPQTKRPANSVARAANTDIELWITLFLRVI